MSFLQTFLGGVILVAVVVPHVVQSQPNQSGAINALDFELSLVTIGDLDESSLKANARRTLKSLSLTGSSKWYFMTSVDFGDPVQRISMIVDTGSADILVGGKKEQKVVKGYNPNKSLTSSSTGEEFNQHYLDSYAFGTIYNEQVSMPNEPEITKDLKFEVSVTEGSTNLFFHQESFGGILGLGPAGSASTGHVPFFDVLVQNKRIEDKIAMMLCNEDASGSRVTLGKAALNPPPSLLRTAMGTDKHYTVKLIGMSMNSEMLEPSCGEFNSPGDSVIDSGTTEIVLPTKAHAAFRSNLEKYLPLSTPTTLDSVFDGNSCIDMNEVAYSQVPSLQFYFDDADNSDKQIGVTIKKEHYLKQSKSRLGCYWLYVVPDCVGGVGTVLGITFLSSIYVEYNRANKTFGMASTECQGSGDNTNNTFSFPKRLQSSCEKVSTECDIHSTMSTIAIAAFVVIPVSALVGIAAIYVIIKNKRNMRIQRAMANTKAHAPSMSCAVFEGPVIDGVATALKPVQPTDVAVPETTTAHLPMKSPVLNRRCFLLEKTASAKKLEIDQIRFVQKNGTLARNIWSSTTL
eukprot:m.267111 g.267111  ORF g.267111 m.267111 type:complete len:573 (+) comp71131_c0_seq1:153-1871(+)